MAGCGGVDSQVTAFAEDDPARIGAEIDHGPVGTKNADVYPYETALDELKSLCPETREQILDMAVAGRNKVREEGADISVLELLEEAAGATQAVMENVGAKKPRSCNGPIAIIVLARVGSGG